MGEMAANIVSTIVTAFTTTAQSIGTAIVSLFQSIFMKSTVVDGVTTYDGISDLGIYVLVLAGIGFAFGLSKVIFGWIRSKA